MLHDLDLATMPHFYLGHAAVQLSVADLTLAKTAKPDTSQSGPQKAESERIASEFAFGSKHGTLAEIPLCGEDGLHTRFLGKSQDMPFFMVHAGKNLFALKSSEKRNRRAERIPLYETSYGLLPFDTPGKIKAQADPQNKGKPPSSLIHASKIDVSSYHTRQTLH